MLYAKTNQITGYFDLTSPSKPYIWFIVSLSWFPTQFTNIIIKWRLPLTHYYYLLHPFNGLFSRTTWVSRYQKGKTSLDLNEARDDGVLGCNDISWTIMQTICTSLQTDNHINTSSLQFLQAECSSWCPTNDTRCYFNVCSKANMSGLNLPHGTDN